jgi:hypothetical protein
LAAFGRIEEIVNALEVGAATQEYGFSMGYID